MAEDAANVPEGFASHWRKSGLTDPWEPLYSRRKEDAVYIGIRAGPAHSNSRGFVHGGLISALADNAMGLSCGVTLGHVRLVTVNLTVDFVAAAKQGQWLEIRPKVVRTAVRPCALQRPKFSRTKRFAPALTLSSARLERRLTSPAGRPLYCPMGNAISPRGDMPKYRVRSNLRTHTHVDAQHDLYR
jgi:acyl-coenzyme A thioesterase PaaI-like protein